jgi:tetratricopeptide (TPR) repeat protein
MKNKQTKLPIKDIESVYDLYSSGQIQSAIDKIKILNERHPNQPLLFNLIGACYKGLGRLDGAVKMFEIAISLNPKYAEAYFNLGCIFQDLEKKNSAIISYKKAIEISPNYPEAHNNLGNALRDSGDLKAAIESFEWAIAYKHDFAEAHNNLGSALNDFGKTGEAIKSFEKSLTFKSDYPRALFNLALSYKEIGNKGLSLKMIEKALDLNPKWSDAHLELSRLKKYKKNDPQIPLVHNLVSNDEVSLSDLINYNFTLAKIYEDLEDYQKQFKFLNEANKLRKKDSGYHFDKDVSLFINIKESFKSPPSILSHSEINSEDIQPIFILGMPRSGTSLVHQILSSHHLVRGAGELTKLFKFVMPHVKNDNSSQAFKISKSDLQLIRNQYLDYLTSLNVPEKIIIDKMPLNFRFIGYIIAAFPEAKIIHMKRDPMAICWSIYKHFFPGNSYSYDQADTAAYYKLYENLMEFWNNLYPNKLYDFSYENLTSSQEEETRNLLNYCGLDWDENCLNFYSNTTAVRTTSAIQVKQEMYQGSSEAWKKYDAYLKPLIEGLNYK